MKALTAILILASLSLGTYAGACYGFGTLKTQAVAAHVQKTGRQHAQLQAWAKML